VTTILEVENLNMDKLNTNDKRKITRDI